MMEKIERYKILSDTLNLTNEERQKSPLIAEYSQICVQAILEEWEEKKGWRQVICRIEQKFFPEEIPMIVHHYATKRMCEDIRELVLSRKKIDQIENIALNAILADLKKTVRF